MKNLADTFASFPEDEPCKDSTLTVCGLCSACENNMPLYNWLMSENMGAGCITAPLLKYFVEKEAPEYPSEDVSGDIDNIITNYWAIVTTYKGRTHIRKLSSNLNGTLMDKRRENSKRKIMVRRYLQLYHEGACTGDFIIMKSRQELAKRAWPLKWNKSHHLITGTIDWIGQLAIKETTKEENIASDASPNYTKHNVHELMAKRFEDWWANDFLAEPTNASVSGQHSLAKLKKRAHWLYVLNNWPDTDLWRFWIEQYNTRFAYAKYTNGKAEIYKYHTESSVFIKHDVEEALLI